MLVCLCACRYAGVLFVHMCGSACLWVHVCECVRALNVPCVCIKCGCVCMRVCVLARERESLNTYACACASVNYAF